MKRSTVVSAVNSARRRDMRREPASPRLSEPLIARKTHDHHSGGVLMFNRGKGRPALRSRLLVTLLPLLTFGGGVVGTTTSAEAATTCSGQLVKTITHREPPGTPGRIAAYTYVYYDGTNNCAKTVKVLSYG